MPTIPFRPVQPAWDPMRTWMLYRRQIDRPDEPDPFPPIEEPAKEEPEPDVRPATSKDWAPVMAALFAATGVHVAPPIHDEPDELLRKVLHQDDLPARYVVPLTALDAPPVSVDNGTLAPAPKAENGLRLDRVAFVHAQPAQPKVPISEEWHSGPLIEDKRVLEAPDRSDKDTRNARDRARRLQDWTAHRRRGGTPHGPKPRGA